MLGGNLGSLLYGDVSVMFTVYKEKQVSTINKILRKFKKILNIFRTGSEHFYHKN